MSSAERKEERREGQRRKRLAGYGAAALRAFRDEHRSRGPEPLP